MSEDFGWPVEDLSVFGERIKGVATAVGQATDILRRWSTEKAGPLEEARAPEQVPQPRLAQISRNDLISSGGVLPSLVGHDWGGHFIANPRAYLENVRRRVAVPVHGPRPRRLPVRQLRGDGRGGRRGEDRRWIAPRGDTGLTPESGVGPGEGGAQVEALVAKVEAGIGAIAGRRRDDPNQAILHLCKLIAHCNLTSLRSFPKVPCQRRRIRLMGIL